MSRKKFNISILGESQVGKTSLAELLIGNSFNQNNLTTLGIENYYKDKEIDGNMYKFHMFDTAGQEKYKSVSASIIQIADGFVLVFDVSIKETLDLIDNWIKFIKKYTDIKEKVIIIIGNKIDKEDRQVSEEEGRKYAESNNFKYFETSCKKNIGIEKAFDEIFKDVYELNKNLEKDRITIENNTKPNKRFCTCSKK